MRQRVDTGLASNNGATTVMARSGNSTAERLKQTDPLLSNTGVLNALPIPRNKGQGYVQPNYGKIPTSKQYQRVQTLVSGETPVPKEIKQNANQIDSNIFLGNSKAAQDQKWLREVGITNIINTAAEIPNFFPQHLRYFNLGLKDNPVTGDEDLLAVLEPSFRYISGILKFNRDAKIFVHCHLGISRSSSIVIYYLMRSRGWSFDEALKYVQSKRPIVSPNQWYTKQLRDVEILLRKN